MTASTKRQSIIILFTFVLLLLTFNDILAVKNAFLYIEKLDTNGEGKILGVKGVIQYSYPELNGGEFTYERIALYSTANNRFVEYGWSKNSQGSSFRTSYVYGTQGVPSSAIELVLRACFG